MAMAAKPTINTYISDMLALEQHIATPLQNQASDSDIQSMPVALRVVNETNAGVQQRIAALQARLDAVGGHAGSPVKEAVASFLGVAATAVDKVRKSEVAKSLRDDFTALSLSSAGYTMLHTTALGLGDDVTATLSKNHLADVATQIMRISNALPVIVLAELQEMGVAVDPSVSATANQNADDAWQEGGVRSGSGV